MRTCLLLLASIALFASCGEGMDNSPKGSSDEAAPKDTTTTHTTGMLLREVEPGALA